MSESSIIDSYFHVSKAFKRLCDLYADKGVKLELRPVKNGRSASMYCNQRKITGVDLKFIERLLATSDDTAIDDLIQTWSEYIMDTMFVKTKTKTILLTTPRRNNSSKGGRKALNITEAQIKYAIQNSKSNAGAARFLGISHMSYMKYAKLYDLWDEHRNMSGKGIRYKTGIYIIPLGDVYEGKHRDYPLYILKQRLLDELVYEEKCQLCGFDRKREWDQQVPLELAFLDGNKRNFKLDNLQLLCWNCEFLLRTPRKGRLVMRKIKKIKTFSSVDSDTYFNEDEIDLDSGTIIPPETPHEVIEDVEEQSGIEFDDTEMIDPIDNLDDIWKKFNK